ncbi:MAG: zinc-ribbon domain-containing protein [Proteobacteria bacterium]|nr:zinc-ribbon domain-containing protein [Pseudomonadota bacterium]
MIRICCPSCATAYDLPDASIGPGGRKVRCAACQTLWLAEPTAATDAEAVTDPAPAPAVEAPAIPPPPAPRRRPWHERIGEKAAPTRARWPYVAAILLLLAGGGLVGFRKSVVARAPETGRIYAALGLPVNLSGLALRNVRSGVFSEGGTDLLVVQGEIANVAGDTRLIPRLLFSIRDSRGIEIYHWTAQADSKDLKAGETQTFRRRLASPPPEGANVLVRFAGKGDLLAMAK